MSKIKWFALLAILTALIFPAMAVAQPNVCDIHGTVTPAVADGTAVAAWIDGAEVVSTTTSNSAYDLKIAGDYAGKTVSFKVGTTQAVETATWAAGAVIAKNLTVSESGLPVGELGIMVTPDSGTGAVMITGSGFTPKSAITIKFGDLAVNTVPTAVIADAAGNFSALIVVPVATAADSANYEITAVDNEAVSATAAFTVPATGAAGSQGPAGPAGPAGAAGKDANMTIVWVSLIVGVIGIIVGAVALMGVNKIGAAMKAAAQGQIKK